MMTMMTTCTPWIVCRRARAAGTIVVVLVILATGTRGGGGGGSRGGGGGVAGFVVNASPAPATSSVSVSVSVAGGCGCGCGGRSLAPNGRGRGRRTSAKTNRNPASTPTAAAAVHSPGVKSSSPLRVRVHVAATRAATSLRAGGASSAALAVSNGGGDDDGSGEASGAATVTSEEAQASIRFAYRACFYSAASDVLSVLLGLAQIPRADGADAGAIPTVRHLIAQTKWPDVVDLLGTVNILAFGAGLVRVHRLYRRSMETHTPMDSSSLSDACRTMGRLWRQSAWVIVMGAMVRSTSFVGMGGGATAGRTLKWATPAGPLGVAALTVLGSFTLRKFSAAAATREAKAGKAAKSGGMEDARSLGFLAARNMALCMGAFVLLALTNLVVTLTKPNTPPVARAIGLTDVAEDLIIARLMSTLNRYYLRAVVTATGEDQRKASFADLHGAQRGFYTKMGTTLFIQSTLQILPGLVEVVVKPLIVAAKSTIKP